VGSGPVLAAVVEQRVADVFPNRVRTIKADSIGTLNFDYAIATQAFKAQHMQRNLAKAPLLNR
jgi:hypothetical protein